MSRHIFVSCISSSYKVIIYKTVSTKIGSCVTGFNINDNNKCYLMTKLLESFLKDYVTLKTGVMMLKMKKEYFKIYIYIYIF